MTKRKYRLQSKLITLKTRSGRFLSYWIGFDQPDLGNTYTVRLHSRTGSFLYNFTSHSKWDVIWEFNSQRTSKYERECRELEQLVRKHYDPINNDFNVPYGVAKVFNIEDTDE